MDSISTDVLFLVLAILILFSAFFSSSETGMLSLNKYRLRHLAKKNHRGAVRASGLLERTDRLISVILIGNNLVNILITIVAGKIALQLFGANQWVEMVALPFVLTVIMLIFAEVTPKSIAAVYPEKIAFPASFVLKLLMLPLYPIVWLINHISSALAKIFKVDISSSGVSDHLHPDELRTVVDEAGDLIPDQHQGMLLNVLDLEKATIEDIIIPRNEIIGLDLEDDISTIIDTIQTTEYTRFPVYSGDINKIEGILHLRNIAKLFKGQAGEITKQLLRRSLSKPYFIPESTPLSTQLMNFQKQKESMGVVVDEYGDVQGIVTLVDILEEIVGDFSTDLSEEDIEEIKPIDETWYEIDASAYVRDINRELCWDLPTDGPKTLNGLIMEYLENIPEALVSFEIGDYRFEIKSLCETKIEKALVCSKNNISAH